MIYPNSSSYPKQHIAIENRGDFELSTWFWLGSNDIFSLKNHLRLAGTRIKISDLSTV